MKKNYFLSFLLVGFVGSAQNFEDITRTISDNFKMVATKSSEISQSLQAVSESVLEYTRIETQIKSGKSQTEVFTFNPADIDANTVRAVTNKELIEVQLLVNRKQKLIKQTTGGQKTVYTNEIKIPAENIDNARSMVEWFKSLIPIATTITENRLSLNSYENHVNWLEQNIGNVKLIDKEFAQSVVYTKQFPGRIEYKVDENAGSKTTTNVYAFNLANINPNSILFDIKGDVFSLKMETRRKDKTVKNFVNNVLGNYTNSFQIICENVEQCRDIQKVLKEAVAMSEKEISKIIPEIKTVSQGISTINDLIDAVDINETSYSQSISTDCVTQIQRTTSTTSKTVQDVYDFNFSDINKNTVKYNISGKNVRVNLETNNKNKLIKQTTDGEQKNYTQNFNIEFSEVEDAYIATEIFKQIITLCEKSKSEVTGTTTQLISALKSAITKVESDKLVYEQTFEDKSSNAMQLKIIEVAEKSSKEKVYEFNWSDINSNSVDFSTSGKNVLVTFNTNYNEKIIQYYEDGAIKNYQHSISLQATDIENARKIAALIKKITAQ